MSSDHQPISRKLAPVQPPISSKMNSDYQAIDNKREAFFQQNFAGINKKVHETFPSIPSGFQLKPVTYKEMQGCGMFYFFMVALPDGKFARVSFCTGGYPVQRASFEEEPEQIYGVDPNPHSSPYE